MLQALRSYGKAPYSCQGSYPLTDAQTNLRGRTHYVDSDTLSYFKAHNKR